jgi:hypothetical protein
MRGTNMASNVSRYNKTKMLTYQQQSTYGVWVVPIDLASIPEDRISTYVVTTGLAGRADIIAGYLYGNQQYDWVLYTYNNVVDTINWPPVGLVIKYPIASYLLPRIS